jgi:cytochrome c553
VPSEGGFNCANCHAVHGSGAYRNLGLSQYMGLETFAHDASNPFAAQGPTYNSTRSGTPTTDGTKDVTIKLAGRTYATANVTFGIGSANTSAKNGMNAYCAVCHGNFHGASNTVDQIGGVDFVRHPTSAVQRADSTGLYNYGTANDQTSLVRPAWVTVEGQAYEAACLSCHKGHGNARGYALIYPSNTGTPANYEEGDAAAVDLGDGAGLQYPLRNLCITCHPMGRY